MNIRQAKEKIQELKRIIAENNHRYYVENSPLISDYDYDMLMNELIAMERMYPDLITPDSPTGRKRSVRSEEK